MPFEYHRARLVKLIDDCMELFEKDEAYAGFFLDGHTLLLEDYLEIKPQKKEKIQEYIKNGKLSVGPWYVLQDEFLTSSEANIRNLLVGTNMAHGLGKVTLLGYFPDTFGNVGQMPQILKQAGIKAAAFGRGVKPTGMNNTVSDADNYTSMYSELLWQAPDGSTVPAILFANWYNNGYEIPTDGNRTYWDATLNNMEKYAATPHLLMMNGCDHQPIQKDLSKSLDVARKEYPEYQFVHSSFDRYLDEMIPSMPKDIAVVHGELTGQNTDGWYGLINTASAQIDLKVMNKQCENLLENIVEPLCVMTSQIGKQHPRELLTYAWKTLMKNHPHDSICSCSCDEVNEEVRARFLKCWQVAETIKADNLSYLSEHVDAAGFEVCETTFAVVNTFAKDQSGVISVDVDVRRIYCSGAEINTAYEEIKGAIYQGEYELVDRHGNRKQCSVTNRRIRFDFDLPEDRFRQPYVAETVTVTFEAYNIPAMGYCVYGIKKTVNNARSETLVTGRNVMENSYLKVSVLDNGTISVLDKENDREFTGLLQLEDVADVGSEYTFVPTPNDVPILSGNRAAKINLIHNEPFLAEYQIVVTMRLPKSANIQEERNAYVSLKERKAERSAECVEMPVSFFVSLEKHSKMVKIRADFANVAKDHRLRVLFPLNMNCSQHKAESIFESTERNNERKTTWTYPSGCDRLQGFVTMEDGTSGAGIATVGLHEYEVLKDNTIALTLLRAVGEMGDWGIFPTETSQVQRPVSLSFAFMPYKQESDAWLAFAAYHAPLQYVQILKNKQPETLTQQFIWNGVGLKPCAFKIAHNNDDIIMRWANYSDSNQLLTISRTKWIDNLRRSNVMEERLEILECSDGQWKIFVKPFEIVTLCCEKAKD